MCGIWMVLLDSLRERDLSLLELDFHSLSPRGPDRHVWLQKDDLGLVLGFHRLAIMDPTEAGDQPFVLHRNHFTYSLICNGEIYNFHELQQEYSLDLTSASDCEVILRLYLKLDRDVEAVSRLLRGVFAFVIVTTDAITGDVRVEASRDRLGVRPMFLAWRPPSQGRRLELGLFSELKGGAHVFPKAKVFPPGTALRLHRTPDDAGHLEWRQWYSLPTAVPLLPKRQNGLDIGAGDYQSILCGIRESLEEAVVKRLMSDREVGFLLSGGLDSSLVAGLAARHRNKPLRTFCIGAPDSTDARWAAEVAKHIGADHTLVPFEKDTALNAIPDVIWATESYDITTVRASVGQYLVSKWISENTDIKVLLLGDGADEVAMGYIYTQNYPSLTEAHNDTLRLLKEIHRYDVLRADRAVARHGLEARVPFLDHHFVHFYLSIPVDYRVPRDGFTKPILREAFAESGVLPKEALWRRKEAFSDGVSSAEDSWHHQVQKWAQSQISDEEWAASHWTYTHNPPPTKEALFYRQEWERRFGHVGNNDTVIPHFWLPRWSGDVTEPSARVLPHYHTD